MPKDIYADTDELIESLRREGRNEWADRLSDAIIDGATGSEIVMALGFHLKTILMVGSGSESIDDQARRILDSVNEALGDQI